MCHSLVLFQVYNIESRPQEPVGGAARFMGAAREFAAEQPLVLFSGDCLNPSLMSAFTRGEQVCAADLGGKAGGHGCMSHQVQAGADCRALPVQCGACGRHWAAANFCCAAAACSLQ